jgi:hypothetical protein
VPLEQKKRAAQDLPFSRLSTLSNTHKKHKHFFARGTEGKKNRLSTFVFVSPFLTCFFIPTFAIFFPNAMPVRILSVTIGLNGSSGVERDNRFV